MRLEHPTKFNPLSACRITIPKLARTNHCNWNHWSGTPIQDINSGGRTAWLRKPWPNNSKLIQDNIHHSRDDHPRLVFNLKTGDVHGGYKELEQEQYC